MCLCVERDVCSGGAVWFAVLHRGHISNFWVEGSLVSLFVMRRYHSDCMLLRTVRCCSWWFEMRTRLCTKNRMLWLVLLWSLLIMCGAVFYYFTRCFYSVLLQLVYSIISSAVGISVHISFLLYVLHFECNVLCEK